MFELYKKSEVADAGKTEASAFKEIKPKTDITASEARTFIDGLFKEKQDASDGDNNYDETKFAENPKSEFTPDVEKAKDFWDDIFSETVEEDETVEVESEGLTQEEKDTIKEETGWSNEIVDTIRNMDEYRIYGDAGLIEGEVNDKKCLMRTDVDWEQKDQDGYTNKERVAEGYAPLDKNGKPIQLHHIGQHADSPLAELTFKEHRTGGNDTILHDKLKETEVHGERNNWHNERRDYWKNRQPDGGGFNE